MTVIPGKAQNEDMFSDLPPKPDSFDGEQSFREGPAGDSRSAKKTLLFDHLVGAAEERERERHTERLGGDQVDDQLPFHRLLDWKVRRLLAVENATDINTALAIGVDIAR